MRRPVLWLALVACLPTSAQAYLLPAESLAHILAESRHTVGMRDVTLQLNADLEGHDHQVDERLYLKRPERARLVQQDDVVFVAVDREGMGASGEDKALKPATGPSANLLPWLLLPRGKDVDEIAQRLLRGMQSVGIDTRVISLGRLGETVAYVIGARAWEPQKPQLWLDKATMLPIRYILPVKNGDQTVLLETRLLEYGGGPGGNGLPRVFEDYQDGKLMRRAEVTGAQFNQDLPETLFEWTPRRRP